VTDPVGKGRVRVKLHPDHEMYHEMPDYPKADAVLALNAGLGSYPTWPTTIHKISRMGFPFCITDQSIVTMRFCQALWIPDVVESINEGYPIFPPLPPAKTEIKLNPFHGVVNRDVAAVLVPNLNNGYLMTIRF
jgi:hypothetical protein